ncbi:DUF1631 domain-containing protein [Massilia sp. PAMC28688]|uniref:DUF1631 family protein n=1 Tax=Massilia sp. PAMC28688 TaxID=2861283 RepID=UPI001C639218|nr:DUF1631 family protein [Massilia sp. PAMC28688]QYF91757.1 DUF1631 domain-containing protein [Massilia sp. PAMC28688]
MHIPKAIIRLAKDRALTSFSALAEQTVVEADNIATRAMGNAIGSELQDMTAVRAFLRGEGRTLRTRMMRHFASLLDRAMITMHAHKPSANKEIDYNNLTLIDDDVVVRQIEIERMVGRLREAEMVALGRVNLTIATLHNDREARERENPFRPYVLARALYEALRELMWDEAQSKHLYDTLGQAMAIRLPGFYASIVEEFESGGVTARLTARPSAMSRAEQDRLAWQRAAQHLAGSIDPSRLAGGTPDQVLAARMLPKLQRLQEMQLGGGGIGTRTQDLLDVVWEVFHKPKGARVPRPPRTPGVRDDLDTTLFELQQEIAAGQEPPAPLALRDLLAGQQLSAEQTRVLDIMALLFESIVHDEQLPAPMQVQFRRLYVPVVRAALTDPELLHLAGHPVRRLIDRLGSVGAAIGPAHAVYATLMTEVVSIIGSLLDLFDDDMGIFSDTEQALDSHVSALLADSDPLIATCVAAVREAEADSARLAGATASLSAALQPLQIDPRLADFILGTWARVLSHPGPEAQHAVEMLPELLWSAQEKTTPEDRAAMMKMLPVLVSKVRQGMASIALPEKPSKAAFDRLVAVHMDVLGNKQERARRLMSLERFREHFADFSITAAAPAASRDNWVGKFELEASLLRHKVTPLVHDRAASRLPMASDADWLSWARPGNGFEMKVEGRFRPALLCAAGEREGAFVFSVDKEIGCAIYLREPLLEAMEHGSLRPLEALPLFDRAVESLMAGAESLSAS